MKRQLSLVLALVMILGTFTSVFAANTVDADAAKVASEFLKKQGVLVGDTTGDLNLGKNLLRQDTVVLVSKLMGEYDKAKDFPTAEGIPTYTDVRDPFYLPLLAWGQANETFVGHTDAKFGFGENLTAQEYAKVLLVALDYTVGPNGDKDVSWKDALVKAKDLGLLEDVEVENASEILRSQMAVMTFNALGTKLKGSDKTLADKLGIEMPAAKELTAKVNDTENLKEVKVELSNAKLANKDKLVDKNNYRIDKFKVEDVTVDGDDVILLLDKALVKDRSYDLTIRGVDSAIDKKYSFKAKDNESPKVVKVEVLGEYGIKVTTSEPVDTPQERNFLVDGKNVAMNLETYGRDIILTPYYNSTFPKDAKTLTVKELEDFTGYKASLEDFKIEIVKDDVAPKVVDVTVDGNVVEVTFDKDIYDDSVKGYISSRSEGNVYYREGRHDIFTKQHKDGDYGEKIGTNKAKYTFDAVLPRNTEVTVVGVRNHSKVEMERTTMVARELKNNLEPEIIDKDVDTTAVAGGKSTAKITLEFDKDVKKDTGSFTLYTEKVLSRYEVKNKIESVEYDVDKDGKVRKDTIVVKLKDLTINDDDKKFDYILEVKNFEDNHRNRMYTDYVEFEVKESKVLEVKGDIVVKHDSRRDETEISIYFNRSVDRVRAENPASYIFRKTATGKVYDVADLDGEIIVDKDGKRVSIVLPEFEDEGFKFLEILETIRDKDNNRLTGNTVFDVLTGKAIVADLDTKALDAKLAEVEKLVEAEYTAESFKAVTAAKALPAKTQAEVDAKLAALEAAVKGLVKIKLADNEIAGNYVDGLHGKFVNFDMPAGKTAIDSATLNGVALEAATFDYAVDGLKGVVNINAKGDVIKVVIDAVEYTVIY